MTPSRAALARSDAKPASERPVRLMQRIYRDVGLSAVAQELELSTPDLETEVGEAVKRGARYVYLAPKADRESQMLPRQPASAASTDCEPPDACLAAVSTAPREPASVERGARHVSIGPKTERDSGRNDISDPPQALPRRSAPAVSPVRESSDASAAAVPASLIGPEPAKSGPSYGYLAPKADHESTPSDAASASQALRRQLDSVISVDRGLPDARVAEVSASPLEPAPAKRAARHVSIEPKTDRESGRNDISGPPRALPRRPVPAISPARELADASAAAVLASLLGPEPVRPSAPYVYLAPKAGRESTRDDTSSSSQALPRQPASAVSAARESPDASAGVGRHVKPAPKSDLESTRNDIPGPSQTLLRQPVWGLLLRRQPASAISPARESSDTFPGAVPHHVNLAPKADRESRRGDISGPSPALLREPASAASPARGSSDASAVAAAPHVDLAPEADRESRHKDISIPPQALLRQPASAVSPAWGLLLRRQPGSAISPARALPDARAAAVAASLLGPSLAGGRAGSSSTKVFRGEAGPSLRTGGERRTEAHKPSVEVPPDRFKRVDKSFWPVLSKI
jgi:hypothetical protein